MSFSLQKCWFHDCDKIPEVFYEWVFSKNQISLCKEHAGIYEITYPRAITQILKSEVIMRIALK